MTIDIKTASNTIKQIQTEINKVFVGQPQVLRQTLCALLSGGHILIEGVPGLGKTLLVRCLAKTFGGTFSRIQFTPDLMPADVTGHTLFDARTSEFVTRKGPVFANILLADEINRSPAKTQSALLEVMQEGQVTIEGQSHKLEQPFLVMATQNPIEQEGTYALPEAQLDRFLLKISISYPSFEEEEQLVALNTIGRIGNQFNVDDIPQIATAAQLIELQTLTSQIQVDQQVLDYAIRITRSTRDWPGIAIGSGPRGGISLIKAAKGIALLEGRSYVVPSDIKEIAIAALRHRIAITPEAEIEGLNADHILIHLLNQTEAPRT